MLEINSKPNYSWSFFCPLFKCNQFLPTTFTFFSIASQRQKPKKWHTLLLYPVTSVILHLESSNYHHSNREIAAMITIQYSYEEMLGAGLITTSQHITVALRRYQLTQFASVRGIATNVLLVIAQKVYVALYRCKTDYIFGKSMKKWSRRSSF